MPKRRKSLVGAEKTKVHPSRKPSSAMPVHTTFKPWAAVGHHLLSLASLMSYCGIIRPLRGQEAWDAPPPPPSSSPSYLKIMK